MAVLDGDSFFPPFVNFKGSFVFNRETASETVNKSWKKVFSKA